MMSGMYPWERMRSLMQTSAPVTTADFTPEEYARLAALRTRLEHRVVDVELGMDDCCLKFARWLVEHGLLVMTQAWRAALASCTSKITGSSGAMARRAGGA